jgi:opacity protein-like surface antigen
MKKSFLVICLVGLAAFTTSAQDVPKAEVFGGYSWAGGNFHGWDSSITGNVNKCFGVTADFSGQYGSERGTVLVKQDAHSFLFGPRITLRHKKYSPFAYALFGATRFHESATIAGQKLSASDTGFSSAVGVGLDVTVNDRVAIRAFQIDYFRPNFYGEAHNRDRVAVGVVFRMGRKK